MRTTISRAELKAALRGLGIDTDGLESVFIDDQRVVVKNRRDFGGSDAYIPLVGDSDSDTVQMRHPDLPGRVIDVRPRGVGQRAMAGWEVVSPPAAEPPKQDPPPESGSKPEAPAETGASSSPPPRRRTAKKKGSE